MNSYFLIVKPKESNQAYNIPIPQANFGGSHLWDIDKFTLRKTKEELKEYAKNTNPAIPFDTDLEIYILKVKKKETQYEFSIFSVIHNIYTNNIQQQETLKWLYEIFSSKEESKLLPNNQVYERYINRLISHIKSNNQRTLQITNNQSIVLPYLKDQFRQYLNIARKNFLSVEKNIRKVCQDYKTLRGLSIQYFNTADNFKCTTTIQDIEMALLAAYPLEIYGYIGNQSLSLMQANSGYLWQEIPYSIEKEYYLSRLIQETPFENDYIDEMYHKYGIERILESFNANDLFSLKDYELVKLKKMNIETYIRRNGFFIPSEYERHEIKRKGI